jgi:sterol desaturase/sphingolipid hydroxylase (fatty acid hydroxylase superfamily)
MEWLLHLWNGLETLLAQTLIAPFLQLLHLTNLSEEPREIAGYFLLSTLQIVLIAGVMRPLESRIPLEPWSDRRLTRIDRLYTLLKLLVVVPVFNYLILTPLFHEPAGIQNTAPLQLDRLFPFLQSHPAWLFLIYFALYDFTLYLVHRLQHALPWWWALHSLHHSQRQLSCWSNDRDHYLDDLFEVLILGGVSALIGIAPVEYAAIVLFGQLIENFSHANVRIGFGPVLDKLLVDPRYHRLHHMRADPARPGFHNCNFALVFPLWDILFGTALYREPPHPCGVDDAAIDADNERGLIGQQVAGLRRFAACFTRRTPSTT